MPTAQLGEFAGSAPQRRCEPGTGLVSATDVKPLPGESLEDTIGVQTVKNRLHSRWEEFSPRYICDMGDVFFVQVGGNCGLNVPRCAIGGDPIWEYATQCQGWTGAVLEPGQVKFRMLQAFYKSRVGQRVTTIKAAVSNYTGIASMPTGGYRACLNSDGRFDSRLDLALRPNAT